jgi:hypothetical protein
MGEWSYSPIRWRYVVEFTPRPFYSPGKIPWYQLDRRLGGSQSRSGCCGEQKHLVLAGNQTPAVQPVAMEFRPEHKMPVEPTLQLHRFVVLQICYCFYCYFIFSL